MSGEDTKPGGAVTETARREILEETGVDVVEKFALSVSTRTEEQRMVDYIRGPR